MIDTSPLTTASLASVRRRLTRAGEYRAARDRVLELAYRAGASQRLLAYALGLSRREVERIAQRVAPDLDPSDRGGLMYALRESRRPGESAAAHLRWHRHLVIALAYKEGIPAAVLARVFGIHVRSVRRIVAALRSRAEKVRTSEF
jgi:hypothetical protein